MGVTTTLINKPLNPRAQDQSPLAYNRAALYSGKALSFDGVNDYVSTANNLPFTSGSDLSIVSYFKIDDSDEGYFYQNSAIYLAVYRDGSTSSGELSGFVSGSWLDTGYIVNDSKWYQVAQIVDNGTHRIYLNGKEIATQSGVSYNPEIQTALNIGKRGGNYLNGKLANLKAFNTALTAAQIADLYNNPEKIVPTGLESNLKLWLPMMEGAGTTAYDGSGNGNHGTISGATYVNGVGAPVAQTSVIDWNKGVNLFPYSEDLSNSQWDKNATRVTYAVDQTTAPDGLTTADEIIEAATTGDHLVFGSYATSTYTDYTASIYMKDNTRGFGFVQIAPNDADEAQRYTIVVDLSDGSVTDSAGNSTGASYDVSDAGNGWYRISVTRPHESGSSVFIVYGLSDSGTPTYDGQFEPTYTGDGTSSLYVWGASLTASSAVTPYVPTLATAQPTPVLLPQGLTTGRDITGVNLFENVRKQSALNLDGQSWAEVHDNASLDVTTAITLEAWVYWDDSLNKGIIGKWDYSASKASYLLYKLSATNFRFYVSNNGTSVYITTNGTNISNGWNHLIGVYDGANIKCYLNGSADGSTSYALGIFQSDVNLEIGKSTSEILPNQIAQPRIYNRALTAEEVQRNYNAGKNIYS